MSKDKEWLKEEIWKQDIVMDKGYIYTDDLMSIINEVNEPEVKQLDKKIRELESYNEELIRDNNQLRNALDNQEVLSQEWIGENSNGSIRSQYVWVDDLQNLLVPKQNKPIIPKFVANEIERYEDMLDMLSGEYFYRTSEEIDDDGLLVWIDENQDTFARAWLDGYEVEEEKKYRVQLSKDLYFARFKELKIELIKDDAPGAMEQAKLFSSIEEAIDAIKTIGIGTVEEVTE